jgi:hypothetical protein
MTSQSIPSSEEIKLAKLEKAIETIQAENFGLMQRIIKLEDKIRYDFSPLNEPVEVVGSWHKTKGNQE